MKLLFITPRTPSPPSGGRALLSALHRDCLSSLLGERLLIEELDTAPTGGAGAAAKRLLGHIDGATPQAARRLVDRARREGVTHIYLDGSNLGRIAGAFRRSLPNVEILCFFHNVEARFFMGAWRETRRLRALGVLAANFLAERTAARASHKVITLSERDSRGLARLYGRGGTHLLPMAMDDKLDLRASGSSGRDKGGYALFVGGAFYANEAGIRWYADQVAPHVAMETRVVGRGLEGLRPALERHPNVKLVGAVDNLQDSYLDATVVIAPIFDGSGMKTKVAEALMFGKKIVGTPEAFSGYEASADSAGWVCRSREEFVAVLEQIRDEPPQRFDPGLRAIYEQLHSREATRRRLAEILAIPRGQG
jgi:hypothetical protein